jgi:hypothetical protein
MTRHMSHCSDEDLVLHHYGETSSHAAHLAACADCASRSRELAWLLDALPVDRAPDRGDQYGLEVWQRIRPRLPEPEPWWRAAVHRRLVALAAAAIVLIAVGVAAGRLWPQRLTERAEVVVPDASEADGMRRRVLLLTVADHLDRSDRMLTDLMNASSGADISAEQQWAGDLVAASRLYRQDALDTDETSVAAVLDELERTLLEIVHLPPGAGADDLDEMRRQIDSAALLFKVRVMSTELRERQLAAQSPELSSPAPTSTIG